MFGDINRNSSDFIKNFKKTIDFEIEKIMLKKYQELQDSQYGSQSQYDDYRQFYNILPDSIKQRLASYSNTVDERMN